MSSILEEMMMASGMIEILRFCEDCSKNSECDQRYSPCCHNYLGYRDTINDQVTLSTEESKG